VNNLLPPQNGTPSTVAGCPVSPPRRASTSTEAEDESGIGKGIESILLTHTNIREQTIDKMKFVGIG